MILVVLHCTNNIILDKTDLYYRYLILEFILMLHPTKRNKKDQTATRPAKFVTRTFAHRMSGAPGEMARSPPAHLRWCSLYPIQAPPAPQKRGDALCLSSEKPATMCSTLRLLLLEHRQPAQTSPGEVAKKSPELARFHSFVLQWKEAILVFHNPKIGFLVG